MTDFMNLSAAFLSVGIGPNDVTDLGNGTADTVGVGEMQTFLCSFQAPT
jgi:hypothetical protein